MSNRASYCGLSQWRFHASYVISSSYLAAVNHGCLLCCCSHPAMFSRAGLHCLCLTISDIIHTFSSLSTACFNSSAAAAGSGANSQLAGSRHSRAITRWDPFLGNFLTADRSHDQQQHQPAGWFLHPSQEPACSVCVGMLSSTAIHFFVCVSKLVSSA